MTKNILLAAKMFILTTSFSQDVVEIEGTKFIEFMNLGLEESDFEKSVKVDIVQKQNSVNFIDSLCRKHIDIQIIKGKDEDENLSEVIHKTNYLGNLNSPNATNGFKVFKHTVSNNDTVINKLVLYDYDDKGIKLLECSIEEKVNISNIPLSVVYEEEHLDSLILTDEKYTFIKSISKNSSSPIDSKMCKIDSQNLILVGKVGSQENKLFYKIYLINQSSNILEFYYGIMGS